MSQSVHPNATLASSLLLDPGPIYQSYTLAYFFIGFAITLAASLLNAFAINLQKLDLNRALQAPLNQRRKDCLRPLWLLGLSLYILSQLLGSTLALQYMRSEYVAPLGSTSLIFNFIFARVLLGTKITIRDALGTLVVILGVIGVIGFGNIRQAGIDQEANMSLSTLRALWARPQWILYLVLLELTTLLVLWLASIAFQLLQDKNAHERPVDGEDEDEAEVERVLRRGGGRATRTSDRSNGSLASLFRPLLAAYTTVRTSLKQSLERWSMSRSDETLAKLDGLLWASGAGLLAGQTLVFAKSYVKLVANGLSHDGGGQLVDLAHPLSLLILVLLLFTGVFQVWCLNRGLKVYDSTLIVPVLFAMYTASGFINSLIYLNELPVYRNWVLFMIWISIAILIFGVWLLSAKRPSPAKPTHKYELDPDTENQTKVLSMGARPFQGALPNPFEEYEVKPDHGEEEDEVDGLNDDDPSRLPPTYDDYAKPNSHIP